MPYSFNVFLLIHAIGLYQQKNKFFLGIVTVGIYLFCPWFHQKSIDSLPDVSQCIISFFMDDGHHEKRIAA
jgi:hypothetical protein